MSNLLHSYRNWVRGNAESAQQIEQMSRLAVFFLAAPTSLLSMEMSHSFVNVLGDINQSVIKEEEEHTNFNNNNPAAQQVQQKINTYAAIVRMIRETQNCGELLIRKLARNYLSPMKNTQFPSSSSSTSVIQKYLPTPSSLLVQLFVAAVELTKLFFRMKQNEDIWKIVLPQMFSFEDVSSSRNSASSSGFDATTNAAAAASAPGQHLKLPHIITSTSENQKLNLSRPDRIGLWLDLIDLIRPVVMSVSLVAGSIWHKRRALHKAWTIWLLGLAYEIIAWLIHNYYLKKNRTAFLRQSTGQLVHQLHDRSREQLIGFHLMKYPFFNLIAEPELRKRVLAPGAWVGKIPLIGGILQGLVEYQIQLQKQCVLYSSGS